VLSLSLPKTSKQSNPEVVFDSVWKKYRRGERFDSLRDWLPAIARRAMRSRPENSGLDRHDFWALRDVSFHVRPGQALGIIGPNGAGKSTILKLLTRILKPTKGACSVRGRVGALIETAAGFHPDLTGRENIYFQGAIMGMKNTEIDRKLTEIIEFSGIGEFIDTQVKRYSSGMNARLGFSIAAHLNPDVLLIDEVIAVGDFAFQQKAYERVKSMVSSDIPVVIVSHQLNRIASLCSQAILLDRGAVVQSGTPSECIAAYLQNQESLKLPSQETSSIRIDRIRSDRSDVVRSGEQVCFWVDGSVPDGVRKRSEVVCVRVRSVENGQILFGASHDSSDCELPARGQFTLEIGLQLNIPQGLYLVEALVRDLDLGRRVANGPRMCIRVSDSRHFDGSVQMNASFRLVALGALQRTRGSAPAESRI
jgi:ABC-type polysaccharide/polyol phosphate transport system ATPase subunit